MTLLASLDLADVSQPLWRRMLRAAGLKAADASEDKTVDVAVVPADAADSFMAALDGVVTASIESFHLLPTADGVFGTVRLRGEIVELAKTGGADGVTMLLGRCDLDTEDMQAQFAGEQLVFDRLLLTDTETGDTDTDKYLGEDQEDE